MFHKSYRDRFTDWELGLHCINHVETDSKKIDEIHSEMDKVILSTRGKSCIGESFKGTDIYKSLKLVCFDKKILDEDVVLSEVILPKGSNDGFYKVTISVLC